MSGRRALTDVPKNQAPLAASKAQPRSSGSGFGGSDIADALMLPVIPAGACG